MLCYVLPTQFMDALVHARVLLLLFGLSAYTGSRSLPAAQSHQSLVPSGALESVPTAIQTLHKQSTLKR